MSRTPFGADLLVQEVISLPGSGYRSRSGLHVTWSTEVLLPLLGRLAEEKLCLIKCHSHPGGVAAFSELDDQSDRSLLPHCYGWHPDGLHGSLVLTETLAAARIVHPGGFFEPIDAIWSIGDSWEDLTEKLAISSDPAQQRLRQAFGDGTYAALKQLRVGVVGASGTGSLVIEALARTGVGELILVDPETVEDVNLNRVLHSTPDHVQANVSKVDLSAGAVASMQFGTVVTTLNQSLHDPGVISSLAGCDVLLGCVDNREARQLLCRLSAFYLLPYLDTGVAIHATETGEIQSVTAAVNYFRPGQSFLSRGIFDGEALRAESLARSDPDHHAALADAGYVRGARVDRPAVMPLNMIAAGWMVMELLERLHAYRDPEQRRYLAETFVSLDMGFARGREDDALCPALEPIIGRGDVTPPLGLPALSLTEAVA
ncbi:MAG: ThiF family adenylyltransferase [Candidatus Thiodiazotropha endolucinida]|nr:ThiF family adenylyltransferase [Candidatus Thiodiazotropha taylori]MCG8052654.1 ThiF family adenylyltransferase [Candidatus Thiodiazotropha taylori]MCW4314475.1 ThiF family adenylyltransferase [Candidatus Thiodiazotropha taylori]MCW4324088.1 ThiF family adenylyltransferase [Candidatus Thiodiazotropha taylori]